MIIKNKYTQESPFSYRMNQHIDDKINRETERRLSECYQ